MGGVKYIDSKRKPYNKIGNFHIPVELRSKVQRQDTDAKLSLIIK